VKESFHYQQQHKSDPLIGMNSRLAFYKLLEIRE